MAELPGLLWGSMGPDSHRIDTALEKAVGKRQSLPHLALAWAYGRKADGSINYAPFPTVGGQPNPYSFLTPNEYPTDLPVYMDWVSWDLNNQSDPAFSLENILAGKHDVFIHWWAKDAKTFARPVLLRFDSEMNGTWWPNFGNRPDKFAQMWRYVVDIFRAEGATNVGWHWCPNYVVPVGNPYATAADKLPAYYPGDQYVDWTGFDAYNEGSHKAQVDASGKLVSGWLTPWMTFSEICNGDKQKWLGHTYDAIKAIAPSKPMCIGEFNSDDRGGDKAAWMADALAVLPKQFPLIRAISLFNWEADANAHWALKGPALAAFAQGIANPVYLAGGTLPTPAPGSTVPEYALVPTIEPIAAPLPPIPDHYLQQGWTTWAAVVTGLEQDLADDATLIKANSALITSYREQHLEDTATIGDQTKRLADAQTTVADLGLQLVAAKQTLSQVQGHLQALAQLAGTP